MRQAGEVTFADAHRPKLNEGWAGYFLSRYSPSEVFFFLHWIQSITVTVNICDVKWLNITMKTNHGLNVNWYFFAVMLLSFHSVVEFASHSDLKNALEKLSGKEINGRKIKLVEASRKKWVILVFCCLLMFKVCLKILYIIYNILYNT